MQTNQYTYIIRQLRRILFRDFDLCTFDFYIALQVNTFMRNAPNTTFWADVNKISWHSNIQTYNIAYTHSNSFREIEDYLVICSSALTLAK